MVEAENIELHLLDTAKAENRGNFSASNMIKTATVPNQLSEFPLRKQEEEIKQTIQKKRNKENERKE